MPTIDFSDEERSAVTSAVRRAIDEDRYPHGPPARAASLGAGEARPGVDAEANRAATALPTGPSVGNQRGKGEAVILISI